MDPVARMLARIPASHGMLARDGLRSCAESLHRIWHVALCTFIKTAALPLWLCVYLRVSETGGALHSGLLRGLKHALSCPETDMRNVHTYHLTGLLHYLWPLGDPHPVQGKIAEYHTRWFRTHDRPEQVAGQTCLERYFLLQAEQRYHREVICIKLGGGAYR